MNADLITTMIFSLVGGLGIFLMGMKYMQQGLQVIAGPRIRHLINAVTSNRFLAVGIGTFITMLVQSSSVTSVMVIGLVNSELMSLSGAIGTIMGANIGTTITGWILALKIGKYGLPILGIATFGWLFIKKEKIRYLSLAILGIGMIFFGLELMKNGFKPIRGHEEFEAWFHAFEAVNYFGVVKAALVGCVLTIVVQSSSATLGITIALANTGVIDFHTAAALVLGENIGTTVTAYLASLGADDINAKRTAYFHILFNISGVAWITAIFHPLYMPFIEGIVIGVDPNMQMANGNFPYMTSAIAAAHTGFNITNTLLFLPLVSIMANFLTKYVKGRKTKDKGYITHLDFTIGGSPVAAIEQSRNELRRLDERAKEMMDNLRPVIATKADDKANDKLRESIFEAEENIDKVQIEITYFLTKLLSQSLSEDLAEEARSQLRLADEFESVSDYITNVLKLLSRMEESSVELSDEQKKELLDLHDRVAEYFSYVKEGLSRARRDGHMKKVHSDSREITSKIRDLRSLHWSRLSAQTIDPLVSTSYMDIVMAYRRIKDHLLNAAEAAEGGKPWS